MGMNGHNRARRWGAGVGCLAAWMSAAAAEPLVLEWGMVETSGAGQQAAFGLLRSSVAAPVVQSLTAHGTAPWLVQFDGGIREEWKGALEGAGGVVRGYVPDNGLLVEASPEALVRIAGLDHVVWAGEYLPAFKIAKTANERLGQGREEPTEFWVGVLDTVHKPGVVRKLGELGGMVTRGEALSEQAMFRAWLRPERVKEVADWGEVEWIEACLPARSWGSLAPGEESAEAGGDVWGAMTRAFGEGERVYEIGRGVADAGRYGMESRGIDAFTWSHPEMLVVAAAGNAAVDVNPADGVVDAGSVGSPATAKNVLSVGAAEGRGNVARTWRESWPEDFAVEPIALDRMVQSDGGQGLAAFSGRGPCTDGRIKPDLVAPGTFVAVPRPADSGETGWGVAEHSSEIYVGGTGVAAGLAAAAARQARQWLVEHRGISAPSAALVRALLIAGARDLAPGQYGTGPKREIPEGRPNSAQGFGMLDRVGGEGGDEECLAVHDAQGLAAGGVDRYELPAGKDGGRWILVLVYTDFPALSGAGRKLVNDLDLTVEATSGAVVRAHGRTEADDRNNVERIEFEATGSGGAVAKVEARNVPMGGSQPYALVICGSRAEADAAAAAMEQR